MRLRPKTTRSGLAVAVALFLGAAPGPAQTVRFVDADANLEPYDGSTWCHGYQDLSDALADVVEGDIDEIRVAAGTYSPKTGGTGRLKTFQLQTGVAIYGGFAGCGEANENERDFAVYETVLSGDLLGNDDPTPASDCCRANGTLTCDDANCVTAVCAARSSCCSAEWDELCGAAARVYCPDTCGNRGDNCLSVVNASGSDSTAVLDGFTITGGYADSNNPRERGAGIWSYFVASSSTIRNCIIRGNVATKKGGGMYIQKSSIRLTNCLFVDNVSPEGSAIWAIISAPVLTNCTISENIALVRQGGIKYNTNDSPTLTNCILWGNHDNSGLEEYAQMNLGPGTDLTLGYSCVQGLTGLFGGVGNTGADPLFVDPDGADDIPGTADDDFRLSAGSPLINTGDPSFTASSGDQDLGNQLRLQGCRVDLGAYETDTAQEAGDFDADGDRDLADFAALQLCFHTATDNPEWLDACLCVFDSDTSSDVDLVDYSSFEDALSGPG